MASKGPEIRKVFDAEHRDLPGPTTAAARLMQFGHNPDREDTYRTTLGGLISPHHSERDRLDKWQFWGGKAVNTKGNPRFNRRKTFMSEWQSACFNGGVFVHK